MEIKTIKEFLYDLSLKMDENDKINLINEYSNGIFYNDEGEIEDVFGKNAYKKIMDSIREGLYNPKDEYFEIDGYGYIRTFNEIDDYYNIVDLMMDNKDEYLDEYKDYLSNVLSEIDNKEDLERFKEIVDERDLTDDFTDEINEKSLAFGKSRID